MDVSEDTTLGDGDDSMQTPSTKKGTPAPNLDEDPLHPDISVEQQEDECEREPSTPAQPALPLH
jgi:hypothetical protein